MKGADKGHIWTRRLHAARFEYSALDVSLKVEESHQRIGLSDTQVVSREDSKTTAACQQVTKVLEYPIDSALEREADDDVRELGSGEMGHDVRQERIVPAFDEEMPSGFRNRVGEIVASARDDVSDTSARVLNVTNVPWDDVHMEMRDCLASRRANVYADVERVWSVTLQDCLTREFHGVCEGPTLVNRRIEPARDVTTGD